MRSLIVVALALLVGCDVGVSGREVNSAILRCESNGGLEKLRVDENRLLTAHCVNGAVFNLPRDRGFSEG